MAFGPAQGYFSGGAIGAPITFPNGTAGAPSMSFTSNTDRGIFNDTSFNGVGVAVGGTFVATFIASGLFVNSTVASIIGFIGRSNISSAVDGNLTLKNVAGTSFGLLQFGGTSSAYPALQRNAAAISFRLADNSADAGIGFSTATMSGKILTYNNITTVGLGIAITVASSRITGAIAANASIAAYTVPAGADASFEVSANILVTTSTTHAFTTTVSYTDEGNTARVLTLSFTLVAGGTLVTSVANANGAVPYMGIPHRIRAKANTAITIATTGTFTTVTYNAEAMIAQVA